MDAETPSLGEKLRLNADLVIQSLSPHAPFELGFDEASVEWVDGFIERQRDRDDFSEESAGGLVNTLGSFLGECIRAGIGGEWHQLPDGTLTIAFANGNAAYPFNKVRKQFANGPDDSILGFYRSTAVIAIIEDLPIDGA